MVMSEAHVERTEQKGAERLPQIVPDYQVWGPPAAAVSSWVRTAVSFAAKRATPDVVVLVTVVDLALVNWLIVGVSDRITVNGVVCVLGVSFLTAVVGLTAYLGRPTNGQ